MRCRSISAPKAEPLVQLARQRLFAGSHHAARRAAALYSPTRTCAQYRVPYFTDVLAKLASGWDADRLEELLPHRWRWPDAAAQNALGP